MKVEARASNIIYTRRPASAVRKIAERLEADRCFIVTDHNVGFLLWDNGFYRIGDTPVIEIAPGEDQKNLGVVTSIIDWLIENGATRRSLVVNVGGGVVSDTGGFAASIFKRGIRYVNVPTTVLAAADAAIGGKTGIDYGGLKNEIGTFSLPEKVIISPVWFATLDKEEILSGFAEIVKMAILTSPALYEKLIAGDAIAAHELFNRALRHASESKEDIVNLDPKEKGLRRILNLGHTAGHAYEMLANQQGRPITHGEGVAHGILVALRLSERYCGLDASVTRAYKERILERYYGPLPKEVGNRVELERLVSHDKKNRNKGFASFVMMRAVGEPVEAVDVPIGEIFEGSA